MKRRILIVALALVLAVGGIAALNIHTAKEATPIEMQVVDSIGDASAAQGLLVDHRIMLGTTMLWYTDYAPATGESDTDFFVTYRNMQQQTYYSRKDNETDRTRLTCSAVDAYNINDPIVKDLWAEAEHGDESERMEAARRVYPIDYYDTYPVYLEDSWNSDGPSVYYQEELAFDKLRVPVGKYDFFELSLDFGTGVDGEDVVDYVGTRNWYMQNRFTPYYVNSGDHILVTAGFPADVEPQADWAPEGFGLWDMPVREAKETVDNGYYVKYLPVTAECRLVYPLDIETQRVARLEQSSDGKYILLVTVEEERFVLHVLDSSDYHLVQRLDIDGAEVRESSDTIFMDSWYYRDSWSVAFGDYRPVEEDWSGYRINPPQDDQESTLTCEYREYPTVSMRQGDGYLVLLLGSSRVALLTPDREGYKGEFLCDAPDYSYVEDKDGTQHRYFLYYDERDEVEYYGLWSAIPTIDADYAMAYNGRYLAAAAYDGNGELMVSVFGKDGLQYAAYVRSSLVTQLGHGNYVFSPVGVDVIITEDGIAAPRPGLMWQS